jgi:hypothetical protein
MYAKILWLEFLLFHTFTIRTPKYGHGSLGWVGYESTPRILTASKETNLLLTAIHVPDPLLVPPGTNHDTTRDAAPQSDRPEAPVSIMTTHRSRPCHPPLPAPTDSRTTTRSFSALCKRACASYPRMRSWLFTCTTAPGYVVGRDQKNPISNPRTHVCLPHRRTWPRGPDALSCGSAGMVFPVPPRARGEDAGVQFVGRSDGAVLCRYVSAGRALMGRVVAPLFDACAIRLGHRGQLGGFGAMAGRDYLLPMRRGAGFEG